MNLLSKCLVSTLLASVAVTAYAQPGTQGLTSHPMWLDFVAEVQDETDLSEQWLNEIFADAILQQSVIDRISRPAERVLNWGEYRAIFLQPERVAAGRVFLAEHGESFTRAQSDFGVPAEVIAAIIGVETYYGRYLGNDRVIEALGTLAFAYPPRASFFRGQLKQALQLAQQETALDIRTLKGSYAGAIGLGQFIPSSYLEYAIDFSGDGVRDLIGNETDAIGSVANYLARHGWQRDAPLALPVDLVQQPDPEWLPRTQKPRHTLGELSSHVQPLPDLPDATAVRLIRTEDQQGRKYWLTFNNFYVITRYNHSDLYAMAVMTLAQALKQVGS